MQNQKPKSHTAVWWRTAVNWALQLYHLVGLVKEDAMTYQQAPCFAFKRHTVP